MAFEENSRADRDRIVCRDIGNDDFMPRFLEQLSQGCRDGGLTKQRLLLAVSGGADSVALLRGMLALTESFQFELFIAHLDHGLRHSSAEDALWVRDLCQRFRLPCTIETHDVAAAARRDGVGVEEVARRVRYEFLRRAADARQCSAIAVAHTADDQAETILHHIIRGTGISGLRGMVAVRPISSGLSLVRPMLETSRADVLDYLAELEQDFREDDSNQDTRFTRNLIRHDLLPRLERQFNPQIRKAILRLGRQAADMEAVVRADVKTLLAAAVAEQSGDVCRIRCDHLDSQPLHLIRETLKQLWRDVGWPEQRMGFDEWSRLADLVCGQGTATLPGSVEARRRGTLLILRRL